MPRAFIAIRIDEPMVYRVVVTALQIIEPRLSVVIVAVKPEFLMFSAIQEAYLEGIANGRLSPQHKFIS